MTEFDRFFGVRWAGAKIRNIVINHFFIGSAVTKLSTQILPIEGSNLATGTGSEKAIQESQGYMR
jgi:hypothetical protein